MATANERLRDAALRHQVRLLRFSRGEARRAAELLAESDAEVLAEIARGLDQATETALRAVLVRVRALRAAVMDQIEGGLERSRADLAGSESEWEVGAMARACPVVLDLVGPSAAALKAAAMSPVNGVPLSKWLGNLGAQDVVRIEQQLRLGITAGETVDQMARRVRGTAAAGYEDGVVALTRRNAEALVRTAVTHTSQDARQATWDANPGVVEGVQIVATLDGRTSPICRAEDGQQYPVGSGPRPPFHVNCRSTAVAVLGGGAVSGERPTVRDSRTGRRRELDFRAEAREAAGDRWGDMDRAQRAEAVARRRDAWARENVGSAPSAVTYDAWLRAQPAAFQDEVLGPGRAALFRGGATLDSFVDARGRELTLAELRARED